MRDTVMFALVVAFALVWAGSCSSFADPKCCVPVPTGGASGTGGGAGAGGTGGMATGGIGGTGCQRQEYAAPGCGADVRPMCTNGTGGACFQLACGCDGHLETGCGLFSAPYAYLLSADFTSDGGDTCDPGADAGR